MTINLTDPANQLTAEQLVTLQLRIMSALSFYRQRPEKEARRMAELLELAGAAASELQEHRKVVSKPVAVINGAREPVLYGENIGIAIGTHLYTAPPAPQPSKMSGCQKGAGAPQNRRSNENMQGMDRQSVDHVDGIRHPQSEPQNSQQNIPENIPAVRGAVTAIRNSGIAIDADKILAERDALNEPACWCRTCRPVTMTDMRFVVCPNCGNKRCPHANDHRNDCTGSNEPGQEGGAYLAAPREVK
ncbi:hypothetical protein [Kluyvera ascorbata]|uniref:hypothetical protein n=1 Tax=Kluyvera ascorbata TaxID=51288 RepID=UPI0039F6A78F